jgi:amino acid transporter
MSLLFSRKRKSDRKEMRVLKTRDRVTTAKRMVLYFSSDVIVLSLLNGNLWRLCNILQGCQILSWFSLALKSSFALVGMAAFLVLVVPIDPLLIATGTCLLFIFLNILGVKEASRLQVFLVIGLLVLMIFYVVFGSGAVRTELLAPFIPMGWDAVFSTTGFVFVSYGGWDIWSQI